ncbi:MAG TPA: PHB depolymerase family esterase [Candidatus Lokiarchaeia archaeon]|nr:PHB depolymerase family esterase [Candidatus Lokiarchaeia archaeon]
MAQESRPSARWAKIITIIFALLVAGCLIFFLADPILSLEIGPRFVILLFLVIGGGALLAIITGFIWVKRSRGPATGKKYVLALFILGLVGVAGFFVYRFQEKKLYSYIDVGGVQRQYILHVPPSYTGNTPVPLLLALHGGSGDAKQYESETGFDAIADAEGFVVVYPDGLGATEFTLHAWNSGYIQSDFPLGDDVAFLVALVAQLKTTYAINGSRVYIVGHSNGAMMAYRMAGERADLFAAVASVAGSVGGKATPTSPQYTIPAPTTGVSVLEVHGLLDQNVPYNGGYPSSGFQVGVRYDDSVNQTISFWVQADNCSALPTTETSKSGNIILDKYSGGKNNTEVTLVTVKDQNHFWENLDKDVTTDQFQGTDLSWMVWNLLKGYMK